MTRHSVPKNSASIANRILRNCDLKRGTIMLLLLLKLYAVQGLFVKYERAVGASPINTLWSSLINRSL